MTDFKDAGSFDKNILSYHGATYTFSFFVLIQCSSNSLQIVASCEHLPTESRHSDDIDLDYP